MKEYTRKNSLRLPGYNYSRPGYYFITICTKNGEAFFGEIRDDQMVLSDLGGIAIAELKKTAVMTDIELDCFIVMPNHVHFIAAIVSDSGGRVLGSGGKNAAPTAHAKQRIPVMIQNYKAAVSRALEFSPWHRSYFDGIIKTQERLDYIRAYIAENPARWASDRLHPHNFEEYMRKHGL